ncbi:tRNA-splicing endonuclease-like protein [Viridothelium virens]|uniref:tRNA-splicing endonuclease-like protein n=1 Tax=Viridothelium virens TaxID=1048519 RepID=A0A6A6HKD2_VIRVR|nr:tRNA-splicing endonuclease-like protein [Viridothelium virens]
MAEVAQALQQLQQLPDGLHLLCPRSSPEDTSCWFEEDLSKSPDESSETSGTSTRREERLQEVRKRKEILLQSLLIFAYNGSDALEFQKWLRKRLEEQLQCCDVCIREYHRARKELKAKLEEEYHEEQVTELCNFYDDMDIERIRNGLDHATKDLLDTEPAARSINSTDRKGTYAIFEALNCEVFLRNETLLKDVFDKPFQLVQTKRRLRLNGYALAMTLFLFGNNDDRATWAYMSWLKAKRNITGTEFDWNVREPLKEAMERIQTATMDTDFLYTFWHAAHVMVDKMDKEVMTHHLRSLEKNISNLALENIQCDSTAFSDVLSVIRRILEESPNDFWDAMGTLPPSSIVDQVFGNQTLDQVMLRVDPENREDMQLMEASLTWTEPFMASIKINNQYPACRALTSQLLDRFQNDRYAREARRITYQMGIQFIRDILKGLVEASETPGSVNSVTVHEILKLVEQYLPRILIDAGETLTNEENSENTENALAIIELTVKLDIQALEAEKETSAGKKSLQHEVPDSSAAMWNLISQANKNRNVHLASSILQGARGVVGLEKILVKDGESLSKDQARFNETLDRFSTHLAEILETISYSPSEDLEKLLSKQESATAVLAPLFSSEADVQYAAINLLKVATHQTGRMEAIGTLLESQYAKTLTALSLSIRRVARNRIFAPMSNFLKICKDAIEKMCDQNGLLRSRDLSVEERRGTETFWQSIWQALAVIFDATEAWSSTRSKQKESMMDFCRNTMEFAESTYDRYAIIAGAVSPPDARSTPEDRTNLRKRLLQHPKATTGMMVRWLRLRDDFLISKSVSLISNLLVRLKDVNIELSQDTLYFIEDTTNGKIRTNLTRNQQAELLRGLEYHVGHAVATAVDEPKTRVKEQTTLTSSGARVKAELGGKTQQLDFDKWRAVGKSQDGIKKEKEGSDELDKLLSDTSKTAQTLKARGGLGAQVGPVTKKAAQAQKTDPNEFMKKRQAEIEAKKKRDAMAIAAAKKSTGPGKVTPMPTADKGTGMMVSSEEESSEDEEATEMDRQLFGIDPKKKKTANLTAYEEEKRKALAKEKARGPVKKQRYQRSAKDLRARLAPDLSPLHKTILGWDYFHEGDFPPDSYREDYTMVSSKFKSPQEYKNTFQPLLTLEAWQGFVKAREEDNPRTFEVKIANRSSVDAFSEVSTVMTHAENKEISIAEGDIVLLSKSRRPTTSPNDPHCLGRVFRITRKKDSLEVLYRVIPGQSLVSSLVPNSSVYGAKILSMIPLEREYGALTGLEYYDLCMEIVNASPSPLLNYNEKQLETIIANYQVNKAQAKAVKSAIDNDAFTLIQGPPGSGKTKTIVGIVGALLTGSIREKAAAIPQPKQLNHNGFPVNNAASPPKKMLVCAPSNAAVDELVMRFKEGVKTLDGRFQKVSVVRLGRSDAMNANVIDVTLDELVNARLNAGSGDVGNSREETSKLMREHQQVSEQLREARTALDKAEGNGKKAPADVKEKFETLRRQKTMLSTKIDSARDNENMAHRAADINRKRAQQAVLDEAHVLCATLSGSGHDMFQNLNIEFETVVVDEAAQCVEMSALIPLKYGCAKCILVGDPKQLPPTVFSKEAARFQYEQSLFARMANNSPNDVHLLDVQYRMHPEISAFPSATFYDGRLLDGDNMAKLRRRPWHADALLGPYRFFDVQGQHQTSTKGHSLINIAEIEAAMQLYDRLTTGYRTKFELSGKVGIITPYKSQLRELRDRFTRRYGATVKDTVEFNTTDAFQGRESEVIIFSCVRASPAGGIGFLQDIRRMNVGLTRAKSSLWVLGNSSSLVRGEFWKKLVEDAKGRGRYTEGNLQAKLREGARAANESNVMYDTSVKKKAIGDGSAGHDSKSQAEVKREPTEDADMLDSSDEDEKELFGSSRSATPAPAATALKKERDIKDEASGGEDVVMKDAPVSDEDSGTRSSTPMSRSSTPSSMPGRHGIRKPTGAIPNKVMKKRPKANPLLPPKRTKN